MRAFEIRRQTAETDIGLLLNLDGSGKSDIHTGCGFLDHMLILFAKHGRFDLAVTCHGDYDIDYHHTVEDIGITLGKAFQEAIGDKAGICRYGDITLPMDEALILSAVDVSGRGGLYYDLSLPTEKVGNFDTELGEEFWRAFANNAGITLHINQLSGKNCHHILEGSFKAVARSLKAAITIDPSLKGEIPSTKGLL